jgi:glycerol uptake facilitator-like aquaporin
MTKMSLFKDNFIKLMVEMIGTYSLGLVYNLMGDENAGFFLCVWIVNLFGISISGAHFNPTITLVYMLRKIKDFGKYPLLGFYYIIA